MRFTMLLYNLLTIYVIHNNKTEEARQLKYDVMVIYKIYKPFKKSQKRIQNLKKGRSKNFSIKKS